MLIIAHRGDHRHPENSYSAIRHAKHYDGVEFDIRASRDKKFFLLHSPLLLWTTNMWKPIAWTHSDALKDCRLKNNEPLPRLEKILDLLKDYAGMVVIEVKIHNQEQRLISILKKYPIKNLIIDTSSTKSMKIYKAHGMKTHYDGLLLTNAFVKRAKALGCYSIGSPIWTLRKSIVQEARKQGIKIIPYWVSSKNMLKRAKRLKVDGIMVDKYF